MDKFTFVLATFNMNKVREIKDIFLSLAFEANYLLASDLGIKEMCEEIGLTFYENSFIKADFVFNVAKEKLIKPFAVIADDSGLIVPSLNNEPGIYSARYAGEKSCDNDNNDKLLKKLKDIDDRQAYFESVITIIKDNRQIIQASGKMHGLICTKPIGDNGFGYDPIFYLPERKLTVAQLESKEKNEISHRHYALKKAAKEFLDGLS